MKFVSFLKCSEKISDVYNIFTGNRYASVSILQKPFEFLLHLFIRKIIALLTTINL